MNQKTEVTAGYISITGRPNVGKSTLFNALFGKKYSIVTHKSHTTRNSILATLDLQNNKKLIFIDTPGFQINTKSSINKLMNKSSNNWAVSADIVILMISGCKWTSDDEILYKKIISSSKPCILVINKMDLVKEEYKIFNFVENILKDKCFIQIIPISAEKNKNINSLMKILETFAVNKIPLLDDDYNIFNEDLFLKDIVREKVLKLLKDEIPYSCFVSLEEKIIKDKSVVLSFIIYVENINQKKIIIGSNGAQIKSIGILSRKDIERYFDKNIHINLWVKIKSDWQVDELLLRKITS